MKTDSFGALDTLDAGQGPVSFYRLGALEREGLAGDLDRLPFSIKVLLESRPAQPGRGAGDGARRAPPGRLERRAPGRRRAALHARRA